MILKKTIGILRHPAIRGIWLGLTCALVAWEIGHYDIFRGLEDWMLDGSFMQRGVRPTHARIVLIGMDEDSFARLGKPPELMSPELAEVVRYLQGQGASAVGLDVFVSDVFSNLPDIKDAGGLGDGQRLGQVVLETDLVVLPRWQGTEGWLNPLRQWRLKERVRPSPVDLGFLNLTEDDDQFVRRVKLIVDNAPHFALAIYARSLGTDFHWNEARQELSVAGEIIPLRQDEELRINFVGPPGTFPVVPFYTVLTAARGKQAMPELRGAIVLIGVTAWTEEDLRAVPFANHYVQYLPRKRPGMSLMGATEIHANIVSTLVDRAFLRQAPWLNTLFFQLLAGALLGMAYARLNLVWGFLLTVILYVGWKSLAQIAFNHANWRVETVSMILLGFLLYSWSFGLRWRNLRRTLAVVKSEQVAQALEQDPRKLILGGQERLVTVLFSDIRDFSTFSECHSAPEVVALLNAYYTAIVPIIEEQGGTITTYLGDGVMVLFGAPLDCPDHALRAVRAAVAVVRRARELKETWAQLGCPEFRFGIGIHTGKVVVGAIGSPQRLDYTAIGDTVNSAARIESENKTFGTEILISSTTYDAVPAAECAALGCALDTVGTTVRGKREELRLHPVTVWDAGDGPANASTSGRGP